MRTGRKNERENDISEYYNNTCTERSADTNAFIIARNVETDVVFFFFFAFNVEKGAFNTRESRRTIDGFYRGKRL